MGERVFLEKRLKVPGFSYVSLLFCSIRLGLFLKRYPIARLFVIIYMVRILRLAVSVSLLSFLNDILFIQPVIH